nr:MAG TPA: hypothetical protein [Caudoviricetes sp.]
MNGAITSHFIFQYPKREKHKNGLSRLSTV